MCPCAAPSFPRDIRAVLGTGLGSSGMGDTSPESSAGVLLASSSAGSGSGDTGVTKPSERARPGELRTLLFRVHDDTVIRPPELEPEDRWLCRRDDMALSPGDPGLGKPKSVGASESESVVPLRKRERGVAPEVVMLSISASPGLKYSCVSRRSSGSGFVSSTA